MGIDTPAGAAGAAGAPPAAGMAVDEDSITLPSAYVITGFRTRGLPAASKACQQQAKHVSSK